MRNINVGQTIQIIANLGVVAGLAFLALEIQQNTELLSAQTRFNNMQNQTAAAAMLVADGELADLVARALEGDHLSSGETLRLRQLVIWMLNNWEYEFREFEDNRLTREELKVESKRQDYAVFHALAPELWQSFKIGSNPSFVEFMETEIQ